MTSTHSRASKEPLCGFIEPARPRRARAAPKPSRSGRDFRLGPAAQLEMMVQRAHAEDPLSRRLEICHLDDHGKRFGNEHAADEQQQQHLAGQDRAAGEHGAERERAGVAHEKLRRMPVEEKETCNRAGDREIDERHAWDSAAPSQPGEEQQRRNHRAGGEAVEPVGEIDGVRRAQNRAQTEGVPDPVRHVQRVRARVKTTSRRPAGATRSATKRNATPASAVSKSFVRARSPRLRPLRIELKSSAKPMRPHAMTNPSSAAPAYVGCHAAAIKTRQETAGRPSSAFPSCSRASGARLRRLLAKRGTPQVRDQPIADRKRKSERRGAEQHRAPNELALQIAFTLRPRQRRGPGPRQFSTTIGVCSSPLPCGLIERALARVRARRRARRRGPSRCRDRWHRRSPRACPSARRSRSAAPSGSSGPSTIARS